MTTALAERLDDLEADDVDDVGIDREIVKEHGLRGFVRVAWHLVEPARPFVDGWHLGAIAEHLQAISEGEITRLVINVPPGSMKSLNACVFWPAWSWIEKPHTKWIFASYSAGLSRRDAIRARRILESDWFQRRWGSGFQARTGDEWTATKYANDRGGFRLSTSVAGQVTGDHADVQVVDDPIKPQDVTGSLAVSRNALDKAWTWWNETMATRLVDFEKGARVIIMQRLHEDDLAGRCLRQGGYEHLCLPMEFDAKRPASTSIGFSDPRKEPDALLWPERFPPKAVAKLKKELGSRGAAAQLQQTPSPPGGAIFKIAHFRFYYRPGWERLASPNCIALPRRFEIEVQSWDCAFKGKEQKTEGSHVAGQTWGQVGPDSFLLDQVLERLDLVETCREVAAMSTRRPGAVKKLVEDAANGPAVVASLKDKIAGFELVPTGGGKEARAHAVTPIVEGGNVYLPHPEMEPKTADLLVHLEQFPAGSVDDDVDALTHALVRLHLHESTRYVRAMKKLGKRS